jgi:hypothetical protein
MPLRSCCVGSPRRTFVIPKISRGSVHGFYCQYDKREKTVVPHVLQNQHRFSKLSFFNANFYLPHTIPSSAAAFRHIPLSPLPPLTCSIFRWGCGSHAGIRAQWARMGLFSTAQGACCSCSCSCQSRRHRQSHWLSDRLRQRQRQRQNTNTKTKDKDKDTRQR